MRRYVVGDDPVAALALQLGLGVFKQVFGLGGETDHKQRSFGGKFRDGGENVGVFDQLQWRHALRGFLDFLGALVSNPPIGDGGGKNRNVDR